MSFSSGFRGFSQDRGGWQPTRILQPLMLFILVASIIDVIIAGIYGRKLAQAPEFSPRPSTAELVFYNGTMPFISTLCAVSILATYVLVRINLLMPSITAGLTAVGFIAQASVWVTCEDQNKIVESNVPDYCPQYGLGGVGKDADSIGPTRAAGFGKTITGWIVVLGWLSYVMLALYCTSTRKQRSKDAFTP